MSKKWVNQTADDAVTISGSIQNYETRRVASVVNYNAQILNDALNRISELEKIIKLKTDIEGEGMNFPRREEVTNKELILTIIEIQGYLSRYGKTHTNWHETLNEVIERLERAESEDEK